MTRPPLPSNWYSVCRLGAFVFQENSSVSVRERKRNLACHGCSFPLPLSPSNSTLLAVNLWERSGAGSYRHTNTTTQHPFPFSEGLEGKPRRRTSCHRMGTQRRPLKSDRRAHDREVGAPKLSPPPRPITEERPGLPPRPGDLLHAGAGRILGERGFGCTAAGGSGPQNARPTRAGGPAACAPRRDTDGCSRCGAARGVGEVTWPGAGDPVGIREPRDLRPPSSNRAPS
ncbi:hypothetical protein mRhiFer1_008277 [Rhinolophus ferrumequinum]|uniref:Uncharacterized protein n=1 Tax=Rhinolophus ferrumequinum TaxID=59479 RepID=A0A7J7VQW7_RHIFE|nr:hypothetical protein mRhiFer1_008277 [Rhinolophus ferrumequinum]